MNTISGTNIHSFITGSHAKDKIARQNSGSSSGRVVN